MLSLFPEPAERQFVARKIYSVSGGLANVGRDRAHPGHAGRNRGGPAGSKSFAARLGDGDRPIPLLTGAAIARPQAAARGAHAPAQFRSAFCLWTGIFFAAFLAVHAWWSCAGSRGDQAFLPALLLLTGIGLILMVSLRDPVRDSLIFVDFAQGAAGGCLMLAAGARLDYERLFGKLSYVPLLASFVLSVLLIVFGYGPGDERRQGQPVRLPAGGSHPPAAGAVPGRVFRHRWDVLRHARETRESVARLTALRATSRRSNTRCRCSCAWRSRCCSSSCRRTWARRWCSRACSWCSTRVARGSWLVPAAGLALIVAGFAAGYVIGVPAHRGRARLDVALAVGQPGARRRSAGALAVGLRHRRDLRHGARAGRRRNWCPRPTPTWCSPRWARSGASSACSRCSRSTRWWCGGRCASPCARAADYEFFLGHRTGALAGAAAAADCGRRARAAAAFRRGRRRSSATGAPRCWPTSRCSRCCSRSPRARATDSRDAAFRLPVRTLGTLLGAWRLVIVGKAAYVQVCARRR